MGCLRCTWGLPLQRLLECWLDHPLHLTWCRLQALTHALGEPKALSLSLPQPQLLPACTIFLSVIFACLQELLSPLAAYFPEDSEVSVAYIYNVVLVRAVLGLATRR